MLLASAVQLGGVAMTSLVVGFLPVTMTLVGARDHGAVPLKRLLPSLALCTAGIACIAWQSLNAPGAGDGGERLIGLLCALGALASWTAYAVVNSRWLGRLTEVSAHDWSLATGVMTGAQALLLVVPAMLIGAGSHDAQAWGRFAAVSAGVAIFASIVGNALWNRMSQLLPLTLAGQMILFETLFALLYGFIWEQRLPTRLEVAAIALVIAGVATCLSAHRPRAPTLAPGE